MNNFQFSTSEFYRQSKYLCKTMLSKSVPICDFDHIEYNSLSYWILQYYIHVSVVVFPDMKINIWCLGGMPIIISDLEYLQLWWDFFMVNIHGKMSYPVVWQWFIFHSFSTISKQSLDSRHNMTIPEAIVAVNLDWLHTIAYLNYLNCCCSLSLKWFCKHGFEEPFGNQDSWITSGCQYNL